MTDNTASETPDLSISNITIEEEMKNSYLDYAMSVIVSRALPDVRDGLKPVHRRILYSMYENNYDWTKPYRKSARVVGDVMGKYHPHGDSAIYDAMVRMAQDFSLRLPLIDGQGNFGSMDGDPPAAMRYTEARMAKTASGLLEDIDKDTVTFQPNYDESEHEPTVLPARFPNILVNGAGGIAVGMATNIPPHNLGELLDACCAYIDNPEISLEELVEIVPGPDFPTGGLIMGGAGSRSAEMTGRGSVIMRGRTHIEEFKKDREAIIITEVPYQVNKSRMIENFVDCVKTKKIEGISDIRDESDRDGVRVVVEVKRDSVADVVLNQLFRYTPLQTSFGANMLALSGGRPQVLNLHNVIEQFVRFREEVITRRTKYKLGKARDRAHLLVGLVIAVNNLDKVVAMIRKAPNPAAAREALLAEDWDAVDVSGYIELINEPGRMIVDGKYKLSEKQVRAILELRLHRLTALGRDDIGDELKELSEKIEDYIDILQSRERLYGIMRDEFIAYREEFATPRRSEFAADAFGFEDEDLIQVEDMVVTVTTTGYIKRVALDTYRAQRRGGKGRSGMSTKEEDVLSNVFVSNTHVPILFFSNLGQVYKLKVWKLPLGSPTSKGKALINLLPLQQGETISTILPLPEDEDSWENLHAIFATAKGNVRRNLLSDFSNVRANGKIAIRLSEGDSLVGVAACNEDDDVLMAAKGGKCIRFPATKVRLFKGRNSDGVRGIKLADGDEVVSMSILHHVNMDQEQKLAYLRYAAAKRRGEDPEKPEEIDEERLAALEEREEFILSITVNGYGKRTSSYEYRITGRGGSGLINIETSERNGDVIAAFPIEVQDQLMMVTDQGRLIRVPVHDVRIAGRNTQGVTLFKVGDEENIVSVDRIQETEDDEEDDGEENAEENAEGSDEADNADADASDVSDEDTNPEE
ncbi:DNA gyrase subunit A [Emcibacteraceae bacterium]|uniref:DNA gyrase subunit A n=1 Tax=Pseudemcibacter sp. TaxID=2943293 RepID=UPI00230A82D2|nr:DNA gyrase subunit A [Emcibacteraceae bacterium]MDA9770064.1 DNA gyrase subunit A [Emcibacteraceae bacterium]MDG1022196.1 DNA gyrase subunit A [Emcibacteraceae bacterium]MDG1725785.1 DNA gyrase subunit A [Emcibacteraceae bacterium]